MAKRKTATAAGTRIGRGAIARGHLVGEGHVRVEGLLVGRVSWVGTLEIAASGRAEVDGDVTRLDVMGSLEGNLRVGVEAHVGATGSWIGSGEAPSLGSEPGGRLEGRFRILPSGSVSSPLTE